MMKNAVRMVLLAMTSGTCFGAVRDVDDVTERQWINYALPLPHSISIKQENIVAPRDIRIRLGEAAGDVEKCGVAQLAQFIKEQTGYAGDGDRFEILIGVVDQNGVVCGVEVENSERLKSVPNHEQAYLIQPVGDNSLVLAALKPEGVYYATQTLRQLLSRQIGKDTVPVPPTTITDWPDMDQRGLWNIGYRTPGFVPWLASLKLNFASFGAGIILKKDEKVRCATLPIELIAQARDHAFLLLPHSPHFDYWWRHGLDTAHPELIGKGDGARNPRYGWGDALTYCRVPCMATPLLTRLVTEWVESAAEQGLRGFSLWLSEHTAQCECAECLKDGRHQMRKETEACIDAIAAARRNYPDLQGRIFLTMGFGDAVKDSYECLELLPLDIKCERVYGRNEAFDKFAADGRWVVDYSGPPLGPGYFTIRYMADEVRDLMRRHHDAKYSGLFCRDRTLAGEEVYGHWEKAFCNYQFSALAEWSWNADGRSVQQFAEAWATVNGFRDPAQFAAWVETIRPVESLVRYWEDTAASNWVKRKDGSVYVTKLPEPATLRQMFVRCAQAVPIAETIEDPSALLETRYLKTSLRIMEQINNLCSPNADQSGAVQAEIPKIDALLNDLDQLGASLMMIPAIEPKHGPQQSQAQHDRRTRELRARLHE